MQLSAGIMNVLIALAVSSFYSKVGVNAAPVPLVADNINGIDLVGDVQENNKTTSKYNLLIDGLFEGDLKISEEFILEHYNLSSIPGGEELLSGDGESGSGSGLTDHFPIGSLEIRDKRAARNIYLWENRNVQYEISSQIPPHYRGIVQQAIDHWDTSTCLSFTVVEHQYEISKDVDSGIVQEDYANYVEFVWNSDNDGACSSDHVGKKGGRQVIELRPHCTNNGTVIHEIGHAVGFWHEQSRPDRDNYIRINLNNLVNDDAVRFQFMKLVDNDYYEVDYQGTTYDYGSIMHYPRLVQRNNPWISKSARRRNPNGNIPIMEVIDQDEYRNQQSPTVGQRNGLSSRDIEQTNRLYSCPGIGKRGFLMFKAIDGTALPYTDPPWWLDYPDPYIKFSCIDSAGNEHARQTSVLSGTVTPNWNEWVYVTEREWQFFRLRVWDQDGYLRLADDYMSMSETVVPAYGVHTNNKHCSDSNCDGYIMFDYYLLQLVTAKLHIKILSAHNLPTYDPWGWWSAPDPYVKINAMQSTGSDDHEKKTSGHGDTHNPTWNEWIKLSCQRWAFFHIQIWDEDGGFYGSDDAMSEKEMVTLPLNGNLQSGRLNTNGGGYLDYEYKLILDGNECSSGLCYNGGICQDLCSDYICSCVNGYAGANCEHHNRRLSVTARYGRNLPDEDPWWNDSDPYMEFVAVDSDGNSVRKITNYVGGDQSPDWNESLDFGINTWKTFMVRVYDDDYNADDPLSDQETFTLDSSGTFPGVRHDCHSGHVIFDYSFE